MTAEQSALHPRGPGLMCAALAHCRDGARTDGPVPPPILGRLAPWEAGRIQIRCTDTTALHRHSPVRRLQLRATQATSVARAIAFATMLLGSRIGTLRWYGLRLPGTPTPLATRLSAMKRLRANRLEKSFFVIMMPTAMLLLRAMLRQGTPRAASPSARLRTSSKTCRASGSVLGAPT